MLSIFYFIPYLVLYSKVLTYLTCVTTGVFKKFTRLSSELHIILGFNILDV